MMHENGSQIGEVNVKNKQKSLRPLKGFIFTVVAAHHFESDTTDSKHLFMIIQTKRTQQEPCEEG